MSQAKETGKTMVELRSKNKLCHWGIARGKNGMRKDQQVNEEPCKGVMCCCLVLLWALGSAGAQCGQAAGALLLLSR